MQAGPAPEPVPWLSQLAQELVVGPRVAPAASLAVARHGPGGWAVGVGAAGQRRGNRPITPATPFDLASVTKPFVATLLARLASQQGPAMDTPLGELLDEARGSASNDVPLELLLSHRSGLEAHRPLFQVLIGRRGVDRSALFAEAADARRGDCTGPPPPDGFAPVYSDLGYLLLGEALARAHATPLDRLVEREIVVPLGLDAAPSRGWLGRDPTFPERVAPTEHVAWRGGELVGVVHDENAWALGGHGLSGHAGLFATAGSLARFGAALVDALAGRRSRWLAADAAAELVRERPGGTLRAGFDGLSPEGSSAGGICGPSTFGHLGFTGTSLWCDPDAGAVAVLLTNRVNPTREHTAIRAARPRVHDALFTLARNGW
jgi:CubicO group peptidase (beta-lactamase class C family)